MSWDEEAGANVQVSEIHGSLKSGESSVFDTRGSDMKLGTKADQLKWEDAEQAAPPPPLQCLDFASTQPAALLDTWQHVVDGLTEQIALLDQDWTILVVNQSWANVAELYGHFALVPGTDYLQFCREMADGGLDVARDVVAGIEKIIAGKSNSFQLVYQASDPEIGHEHQLCVNRFEVGGRMFSSITRYDITRLVELRRLREDFSKSVLLSQADERRRIGREIHDSTMQLMVCLDMKIGQFERSGPTAAQGSLIDEMRELVTEAQQAIRSISYLIHPPLLGKLTLPEALMELVEGFSRRTGLDVKFETVGEAQMYCPAAEEAAYRIVQEALSNVHRHSNARHATVRLSQRGAITHVVIADDGTGMPDHVRSGVGLAGMRSRLSELGGRLFIRSRSPGTAVIASIPVKRHGMRGLASFA
jgi:two-component system NarL family sensor kinase